MAGQYRTSLPGRLVFLSAALFFAAFACKFMLNEGLGIRLFVVCMTLAIVAMIFAMPLGALEHGNATLAVLVVVPFLVWMIFPFIMLGTANSWHGLAALLVSAVGFLMALRPPCKQTGR
jgi:hypothetical protein